MTTLMTWFDPACAQPSMALALRCDWVFPLVMIGTLVAVLILMLVAIRRG